MAEWSKAADSNVDSINMELLSSARFACTGSNPVVVGQLNFLVLQVFWVQENLTFLL